MAAVYKPLLSVELFDLLGRKAQEIFRGAFAHQKEIAFVAANLASGIYFATVINVISRRPLATTKLVLRK